MFWFGQLVGQSALQGDHQRQPLVHRFAQKVFNGDFKGPFHSVVQHGGFGTVHGRYQEREVELAGLFGKFRDVLFRREDDPRTGW